MATFKVGQRVRIVKQGTRSMALYGSVVGFTGTITAIPPEDANVAMYGAECGVRIDNFPPEPGWGSYAMCFWQLEPLTDPKADEFIETVKKWKPEPVAVPLPIREKA